MTTENENPQVDDEESEAAEPSTLDEMEVIQSEPSDPFSLSSGTRVKIVRLRTRETMALLKILTKGAGDVLAQTRFSSDMDPEEFMGIFIGSVILSVPEAEDETIDFVRRMVVPEHYIEDARTKPEVESNTEMTRALYLELDNPPLDDLIAIVERIVRVEAPHILALGKRLAAMLEVQRKSTVAKKPNSRKKSSASSSGDGKG